MESEGLDISLLETDGSHYVVTSFILPYYLELPEEKYEVKVKLTDKELVVQAILEHIEAHISDGAKKPVDEYTSQHHTKISIYIPLRFQDVSFHSNFNKVQSAIFDNYEEYRKIGIQAVNHLILIYRHLTGEFHVRPITSLKDFSLTLLFNKNSPQDSKSRLKAHRKNYYTTESIIRSLTDLPPFKLEELRNKLLTVIPISLVDELLLNAYYYLYEGNFRLAIIEAETAFEIGITQFILNHYKDKPEKIQEIERINSFTNLLQSNNVMEVFRSRSKSFKKEDSHYAVWEENVWKVRGAIVHGKRIDVQYPVAETALKTIEVVLEYLLDRPSTQLRSYTTYNIE